MNKTIKFLVNESDQNKRVDIYLSKKLDYLTRTNIKKLIEANNLVINKENITSPATKIKKNDEIQLSIFLKNNSKLVSSNMKLDIIYEDNDIIIINKPQGLVVHPGAGNTKNTLANGLVHKFKKNLSNLNGSLRPGIVHRIDKDTSGILVVAKNNFSHSKLNEQFSKHNIGRKYICLVWGVIRPLQGRIISLISRSKKNRQLMTVSEINGKKAITNYKTLKTFTIKDVPKISLIECELETGRTHQIRVHLRYKGASIIGDKQYGKKNLNFKKLNKEFSELLYEFKGQALHAKTLVFMHPSKKKIVSFKSNLPPNFEKMLNLLNNLNG